MLKFWSNHLFLLLFLLPVILNHNNHNAKANDYEEQEEACEFQCLDGSKCVPWSYICDTEHDCDDHSDELHCLHESECNAEQFTCSKDECIENYERCNGIIDCSNGVDEINCYEESTPKHPLKWHFSDCKRRDATLMFVVSNNTFYCIDIENDEIKVPKRCFDYSTRPDHIASMDAGDFMYTLYTTKNFPNQIQRYTPAGPKIVVKHKIARFEEIALDQFTGNIYFMEHDKGIGLCNHNNTCAMPITTSPNQQFRNLVLHPKRGAMFWIDWSKEEGHGKTIQMASMDGKDQKQLYAFTSIYAISLDEEKEMMYMATEDSVTKLNLVTMKSEMYATVKASSILYYNCQLFYTDRVKHALFAFDKDDKEREIGNGYRNLLPSLAIESHDKFSGARSLTSNPCRKMNCSDLCVLSQGTHEPEAHCILGETMPLPDQRTNEKGGKDEVSIGWIVILCLVIFVIFAVVLGVMLYFGVFPKLNSCLRIRARKIIRATGEVNMLYDTKSETISS